MTDAALANLVTLCSRCHATRSPAQPLPTTITTMTDNHTTDDSTAPDHPHADAGQWHVTEQRRVGNSWLRWDAGDPAARMHGGAPT